MPNQTSTRPAVTITRYAVAKVPGLDLWFVRDTANPDSFAVTHLRADKIVADMEAGDLNFQLQYDTDEAFRTAYQEWAGSM